ncbi:LuxR C-terminal-related transcriptional regulator [Streptomyces sp. NPDC088733]|uniref:LuxR C-terminal-related transcriptional regulator n=1 Tax=Streptomyces sp. NPDC088733 TaxID=3365880 RepID=UPI00382F2324
MGTLHPYSTPRAVNRSGKSSTPRLLLDERQRRLVLLLLAGHTDASAAEELAISPRTVTNILRGMMNRLGVDNRFQLGVALGARMHGAALPGCASDPAQSPSAPQRVRRSTPS